MSEPKEEPNPVGPPGANPLDEPSEADVDIDEPPPRPEAEGSRDLLKLEIDVREDPFSIHELVRMIDGGRLILAPEFQRREVWDDTRRSRFIESVLLNYPLPPLYLNQRKDGAYLVVDGLQRTSSVYRYIKGKYALQELETLHWLNGLYYGELEPLAKARIEDRKLACYVLKPSVPFGVVHDIFTRINTGGMVLNRQELRHAFYQGPATALLKDLANSTPYKDWIGDRLNPRRMGNEEAALRCIAFARVDPDVSYKGNLDSFLNDTLKQLNDKGAEAERLAIPPEFARIFLSVLHVLGQDSFRIPTERTRGRLNLAVMESIYRVFASHPFAWVAQNLVQLSANYQRLITLNEYRDVVNRATSSTRRVRDRFRIAREVLEDGCVWT